MVSGLLFIGLVGCVSGGGPRALIRATDATAPTTAPTTVPATEALSRPAAPGTPEVPKASVIAPAVSLPAYLLHLPGIGGTRNIDDAMAKGFRQGGFTGDVDIHDWTGTDAGLTALIAHDRHRREAKLIAQKITERFDKEPSAPIYLTCHSGGGGLAVWALEDLPDRVKISTLVMMSPALSPQYDLTAALRHVSGKAYVFSSMQDVLVLGIGCKTFGTIDGIKTDAAGRVGFVPPANADPVQYAKLVPMPYQKDWVYYGDYGDHVGAMNRRFARQVLAPLVLSGKLPAPVAETSNAVGNATIHPAGSARQATP
jgi:pimeloyl-ACP methyl ester carboxylesterase